MKRNAVLVDVSIDQGGCFETSRPTTHSDPTFEVDGITHYCVANMPGAVPVTSTYALTNATLPYVLHVADAGVGRAPRGRTRASRAASTSSAGKVTYEPVAEATGTEYTELFDGARRRVTDPTHLRSVSGLISVGHTEIFPRSTFAYIRIPVRDRRRHVRHLRSAARDHARRGLGRHPEPQRRDLRGLRARARRRA